ncbi:hypothetical protein AKJ65_03425 [candidate division MSBL1 archaeon SCGC-AAA259E19]|uniref:Class III signal peptide-containing protein n=2 Tax=candidate division MSBL1 TaxID=215777 RepID=A0A133V4S0_9EURY|nr:hypothetical protein AKJ65_03425 [candidate division MSBL1 archaeon SCGC-AAA259E19]KXB01442.1 hypothetical protein AKJ41_01485 [candidate division MSBL1 archaeon SCGC-AAA259O05]
MKGQASVETFLILGAVLAVTAGLLYVGQKNSESINAISAARIGAENAITDLELEHELTINIREIERVDDNIEIDLNYWGEEIPRESLEENVRIGALKFIHQAFKDEFPENAEPVSTHYHTFDVKVTAERVEK